MKIARFSLYMLGREKKKSFFYIFTCTFSVMITFLFTNILYNTNYHGLQQMYDPSDYNNIFSVMLSYLVIAIVVAMNFYAYNFYLSSQTKEIGIYLLGGSKLTKIFSYLFVQNLFIFLIALVVGICLGYGAVPLVNQYMNMQMGTNYPIFVYSPTAFWGTIGLTIVILFYLAVVSTGFIHRHEIKELLGMMGDMKKTNEGIIHLPNFIYAFIFFGAMIFVAFSGDASMNAVIGFVAVLGGFLGVCRHIMPNIIGKVQRKWLITHRLGLVSSGNFHHSLVQSCSVMQIFLMICIFMNAYMINSADDPKKYGLVFIAYVTLVISVAMALGYKILLDTNTRKITFKHLHKLGYSRSDLITMIKQEIIALFTFVLVILFMFIGASYLPQVMSGAVTIRYMLENMAIFTVALVVTAIFSYFNYKNAMFKERG